MITLNNAIVVTPTRLNPFGSRQNYMASCKVSGFPSSVVAIASTRIAAIAACSLKAEARESITQRRKEAMELVEQGKKRIKVTCACA